MKEIYKDYLFEKHILYWLSCNKCGNDTFFPDNDI